MRDASGAPNLATGQEIVPPHGQANEMSTGEPVLPQDTPIVCTRKVAEPKRSLVQSSEVFDEERRKRSSTSCVITRRVLMLKEIFEET